jgi:FtsH-binding integral membrane protein
MREPMPAGPLPTLDAAVASRPRFLVSTYTLVLAAVAVLVTVETALFRLPHARRLAAPLLAGNRYAWLLALGAFVVVGWLASRVAHRTRSRSGQYLALGGFVLAQAVVLFPPLVAAEEAAPGSVGRAAAVTLAGFLVLTALAYALRRDFSFATAALRWGGVVVLVLLAGSLLLGFHLGLWFPAVVVGLAGVAILHDTSRVLRDFPDGREAAAALQLFASVALMLWAVLRLVGVGRE